MDGKSASLSFDVGFTFSLSVVGAFTRETIFKIVCIEPDGEYPVTCHAFTRNGEPHKSYGRHFTNIWQLEAYRDRGQLFVEEEIICQTNHTAATLRLNLELSEV